MNNRTNQSLSSVFEAVRMTHDLGLLLVSKTATIRTNQFEEIGHMSNSNIFMSPSYSSFKSISNNKSWLELQEMNIFNWYLTWFLLEDREKSNKENIKKRILCLHTSRKSWKKLHFMMNKSKNLRHPQICGQWKGHKVYLSIHHSWK